MLHHPLPSLIGGEDGMGEGGGIIRYFEEYSQFLANPVSKGGQENIHGYYIPVCSRISTDILRVFTAGAATVPSISLPTQKLAAGPALSTKYLTSSSSSEAAQM